MIFLLNYPFCNNLLSCRFYPGGLIRLLLRANPARMRTRSPQNAEGLVRGCGRSPSDAQKESLCTMKGVLSQTGRNPFTAVADWHRSPRQALPASAGSSFRDAGCGPCGRAWSSDTARCTRSAWSLWAHSPLFPARMPPAPHVSRGCWSSAASCARRGG